jgi:hypothetical protein
MKQQTAVAQVTETGAAWSVRPVTFDNTRCMASDDQRCGTVSPDWLGDESALTGAVQKIATALAISLRTAFRYLADSPRKLTSFARFAVSLQPGPLKRLSPSACDVLLYSPLTRTSGLDLDGLSIRAYPWHPGGLAWEDPDNTCGIDFPLGAFHGETLGTYRTGELLFARRVIWARQPSEQ